MSFVGSYSHTLDAKKRVFVPSKFREDLGDEFYITRKFGTYLSIYTADDWQAYVEKIEKLPESDAEEIQDFILGAAQKCTPDASGRIIIDDRLLSHAGIDKNLAKKVKSARELLEAERALLDAIQLNSIKFVDIFHRGSGCFFCCHYLPS